MASPKSSTKIPRKVFKRVENGWIVKKKDSEGEDKIINLPSTNSLRSLSSFRLRVMNPLILPINLSQFNPSHFEAETITSYHTLVQRHATLEKEMFRWGQIYYRFRTPVKIPSTDNFAIIPVHKFT